mmetsp:Transcript_30453/g.85242  ORF Transcript_30453/g.85242 Transcript_30453/m.85242 type:complete len:125 (-) Transcript_30453:749-1123(-)|eukprot:CAMPEP_0119144076 /NCGR_PEP_ID=MMETSP1310-20130426/35304_1 /TAXON_ID=464262 /ORGANISM="Genus nov. species nov., Strain RCC2339" /LENGTH=124 /DNA_ID=CAMNT_0007135763 /DNA_START=24 /DNA_END=398 /DNA_ORIENTATION=-
MATEQHNCHEEMLTEEERQERVRRGEAEGVQWDRMEEALAKPHLKDHIAGGEVLGGGIVTQVPDDGGDGELLEKLEKANEDSGKYNDGAILDQLFSEDQNKREKGAGGLGGEPMGAKNIGDENL